MPHPDQVTLALHAGGDLGPIARWRTSRHITHCDRCRGEVAAFAEMIEVLPELAEMPEVPWSSLSGEMKANIRLGLAAGECVRPGDVPLRKSLFSGVRAAVAVASVAALLVTGLMLEHPVSRPNFTRFSSRLLESGIVLESTQDGIEVGTGRQALQLRHAGASAVTYSVGAEGSIRARYLDPKTGYVTINNVYVEE